MSSSTIASTATSTGLTSLTGNSTITNTSSIYPTISYPTTYTHPDTTTFPIYTMPPEERVIIDPIENGYKITFKGKEWAAHDADELTDLLKQILVTDKLTEALTPTP